MTENKIATVRDIVKEPGGAYLGRVYLQVSIGVGISTLVAYLIYRIPGIQSLFLFPSHQMTVVGALATLSPLPLIFGAFLCQDSLPKEISIGLFYLINAAVGIPLALLPFFFSGESIVSSAFITALSFLVLSIFAITTKRDLGWIGTFLVSGLTAILLFSVGNLFFSSAHLMTSLNIASVLLFCGYITFNTQMAVKDHIQRDNCSDLYDVVESALDMYLGIAGQFVNLFRVIVGQ